MSVFPTVVLTVIVLVLPESNGIHIGCFYSNSSDVRYHDKQRFVENLTISLCKNDCPQYSHWYGLENGLHCYCGNHGNPSEDYTAAPPSECSTPCGGATNCGGQNVSALYEGKTYKGCYTNPTKVSVPFKQPVINLTIGGCLQKCREFKLIALTQGDKCVCTNQAPSEIRNDSECLNHGVKCIGGDKCGGPGRISIWSFDDRKHTFDNLEQEVKNIPNLLLHENVTDEEVVQAAEVIETVTSNVTLVKDNPELLGIIADALEKLADSQIPSVNVTRPLVNAVNNIMELDEEIIQKSSSETGKVLAALEKQISNLQTQEGNYSQITDNVGIKVVKVNTQHIKTSIQFGTVSHSGTKPSVGGALNKKNTRILDGEDDIARAMTVISVPVNVLELFSNDNSNDTEVPVSFIIYGNSKLFVPEEPLRGLYDTNISTSREVVASQIISVNIEGMNSSNKELPDESHVTAIFVINVTIGVKKGERVITRDCVRWLNVKRRWSKAGCTRTDMNNELRTKCSCRYLGSFAVLIRIGKNTGKNIVKNIPLHSQEALYWITLIGSILSCICLLLCILTFLGLKNLRMKKAIYIHLNLCLSLLGFYVAFMLSMKAETGSTTCSVFSAAVHYFGLVLVLWMSIEAINLYIMFVKRDKSKIRHFLAVSCCVGYGVPIIPVLLVAFLDKSNANEENHYCFLHPGPGLYYGFVLEVGILCIFNFLVYIWIINRVVCRPLLVSQVQKHAKRNEILARVRHGILFWFILGLPWMFGFLAAIDTKTLIFDYIFCILLSSQGVVQFLLLSVTNPEIKKIFRSFTRKPTKSETRSTNTSEGLSVLEKMEKRKRMKPTATAAAADLLRLKMAKKVDPN